MATLKKKIFFVITHLELGGAQKQLFCIIKSLSPDKYSLWLCTGNYGYLKNEFLRIPHLSVKLIPELKREINPFLDVICLIKLYLCIRKNKAEIVHTHSPKASILGRWAAFFAGVKNIIYTVHGWPFHKFMNPVAYFFYLLLEKITAKITNKIIVVSNADYKIAIDNRIKSPTAISLIHYGIDVEKFKNVYKHRSSNLISNSILTISALKRQKGIFDLLKIAKSTLSNRPELNFIIIGDGPLRRNIERKISMMGLQGKVILTGWVDDILDFLKTCKAFILTSLWEGLPITLIEAYVAGIPAVITDTQGLRDIFSDFQNGMLVKPRHQGEFTEAIYNMLDDYEEWAKRISINRQKADLSYWSQERMLRQLNKIYESF